MIEFEKLDKVNLTLPVVASITSYALGVPVLALTFLIFEGYNLDWIINCKRGKVPYSWRPFVKLHTKIMGKTYSTELRNYTH